MNPTWILDELSYIEYGTPYAQLSEGQQAEIYTLAKKCIKFGELNQSLYISAN
jgi:hypothetical protein